MCKASTTLTLHKWRNAWSMFKVGVTRLLMMYGAAYVKNTSQLMNVGLLLSYPNSILSQAELTLVLRQVMTEKTVFPPKVEMAQFIIRLATRLEMSPGLFPQYVLPATTPMGYPILTLSSYYGEFSNL